MATNTMVALYTAVASGSATSITLTGLSGYTDLVIEYNGTLSSTGKDLRFYVNGDNSSGLYSFTWLSGNGSSASSGRQGASNYLASYFLVGSSTTPATATYNFQNYSNSTTYKTVIARMSDAGSEVISTVGLWRNTNAITSVTFYPNVGNFTNGDTFTVYGIASSDIPAYATGGFVSQDSTYWYHAFPMSGTFTPKQALTADVLVIAGGGAGAWGNGGGGGAGGVLAYSAQSLSSGFGYTCTVGAGASRTTTGVQQVESNGSNSQFGSLTASIGGGGGATFTNVKGTYNGASGGSGGGGGGTDSGASNTGGSATSGQGNAGGAGTSNSTNNAGGGGGGAGTSGANGTNPYTAGIGGNGLNTWASWLSATGLGVSGYIAAGGGGGGNGIGSAGGTGGGGAGGTNAAGTAGQANTGSGGGGGGGGNNGANGGSGLIIVRYAK